MILIVIEYPLQCTTQIIYSLGWKKLLLTNQEELLYVLDPSVGSRALHCKNTERAKLLPNYYQQNVTIKLSPGVLLISCLRE
jgi:hypothetical protein